MGLYHKQFSIAGINVIAILFMQRLIFMKFSNLVIVDAFTLFQIIYTGATTKMKIPLVLIALFFLQWKHGHSRSNVIELPRTAMIKEGDLDLGAIIHYSAFSVNPVCANYTPHPVLHQVIHAFVYGVEKINNNSQILPNITLGYVILDDCTRVIPTIPRALQLLPATKPEYQTAEVLSFGKSYDVVGIIGPYNSEPNLVVASMTGFFEVPQLSPYASSDALSDKKRFPYFFRTVSPDRFMIKATVNFMKQIGWEYISIIYSEDEFGYNANKFVRKFAEQEGLCVEESYPIDTDYDSFDYATLLSHITGPKVKSKVFIAYIINSQFEYLVRAIARERRYNDFIMVFSQCSAMQAMKHFFKDIQGSITIRARLSIESNFFQHYKQHVTPWLRPDDPWIGSLWEQYYGCKMKPEANETSCERYSNLFDFPQAPGQRRNIRGLDSVPMSEAVEIFALALDNMIKEECPHAVGNKSLLRMCVKGDLLKVYLSKVELNTKGGTRIFKFNQNYDGIRAYDFQQIQSHTNKGFGLKVIGTYNPLKSENSIELFKSAIQWPLNSTLNAQGELESVCSYPCVKGEIYIQGDVKCCWTCHRCRENEITSSNFSTCVPCPVLEWPNPKGLLECLPIQASFLSWTHMYGLGMTILTITGIVSSLKVTTLIIKNRNRVVVRGSSRELMGIIITGSFMAFLTIPAFIIKPTDVSCLLSRAGVSISCTLLFAPLLVKSIRMFRIFKASAKFKKEIRFASTSAQLVIVGFLILIQVSDSLLIIDFTI